jgi:hypothetical protein
MVLAAHRKGHSMAQILTLTNLSEEEVNKLITLNS